jgi:hypothetical protein
MRTDDHGSLSRPHHHALPHVPVSVDAESRVCNSIHLSIPNGQSIGQYADKWQICRSGQKMGVCCHYVLAGLDGRLVTITASVSCDGNGSLQKRIWFEPFRIDGKKIWIDPVVIGQIHWQAREAYRHYCQPGNSFPEGTSKASG